MKPPRHPRLVLAVALLLPGMGQVLNSQPGRGLGFACFAVLLGGFTLKTAPPEASFVGQVAGAIFVWGLAAIDAYRVACVRHADWSDADRERGKR